MDAGHKETEKTLKQLEKRISKEYRQAEEEIGEKLADYMKRYETKDLIWRGWVEEGKRTQKEYEEWRVGQIAIGQRWSDMRQELAEDYHKANMVAKSVMWGYMPKVYAQNHDYATYEVEHGTELNTSYTLFDEQTAARILRDDPDLLHAPGRKVSQAIAEGTDVRWNKQLIQSVMLQGLLQGESIPSLATRLAGTVGDKNRKAAIRNARTMTTGAQNAGRVAGYRRAENMGINIKQQWVATIDGRTRHSHRQLDGEVQPIGHKFSNGCRYPGDPTGAAEEIYNCRCTLIASLKGFERDLSDTSLRRDEKLGDMTYDEWREAKATSQDILHGEKVGKAMKGAYIREYKGLDVLEKASSNGNMDEGAHDSFFSRERVYYNPNASYNVDIPTYSNEVNEELSKQARRVAEYGSKTGYEYSAVVDTISGKTMDFGSSERPSNVYYYQTFLRNNKNGKYAIVHNHNTESSISMQDIQEMLGWDNIDSFIAVTNNGYSTAVVTNGIKTNQYLMDVFESDVKKMRDMGKTTTEIELEIINKAAKKYSLGGIIENDGRA